MRRRYLICILLPILAMRAAAATAGLPPLIPRTLLFGNPDKTGPRISPDGRRLAYLAPHDGVLNVWVRTIGASDDRAVTGDRNRGITAFFWASNSEQILYIQDKNGDENWHLYAVTLGANEVRDLTPFAGVQTRIVAVDSAFPDEILVGINRRDPSLHDVYRVNVRTGELTLEAQNDGGMVGWTADHDLRVRAVLKPTPDGGLDLLVRDKPDAGWRTFTKWGPQDAIHTGPIAFTPDGRGLYLLDSSGTNTSGLRERDLATGKEKTLACDHSADLAGVFIHPTSHEVQAVSFNRERIRWKALDKSIKEDFHILKRIRRGDFRVINRDREDRKWLVAVDADDSPVSYYIYNRASKKAELLFTDRKSLEGVKLARMEPFGFRARDTLLVRGYLTMPPGVRGKRLPTVVLVHGGPWGRDTWGYNGTAQWLANRGYAVLQINYRGSTGYGKDFVNAANREWGGKINDDLVDGVAWAVKMGITDPKRVAIFGASFGGYATLAGLTFTPDVFCCGVDICGWSNLLSFFETIPPYYKPIGPLIWDRIGHPEKDAELLRSRSPLFHVDQIRAPLLIAQGANDPMVKASESRQIVEALRKAGKIVVYVEYADEGHGFARPENRLDFYAKAEKFLAEHLGGRFEE